MYMIYNNTKEDTVTKEISQEIVDKFFKEKRCKCGIPYEYYRDSKVAKLCPVCHSNSWIEYEPHNNKLKYPKFRESKNYVVRGATKAFPECKGFPRSRMGFVWLTKEQSGKIHSYTYRSEMLDYPHIVFVPTEPIPECKTDPIITFIMTVMICVLFYEFIIKY